VFPTEQHNLEASTHRHDATPNVNNRVEETIFPNPRFSNDSKLTFKITTITKVTAVKIGKVEAGRKRRAGDEDEEVTHARTIQP
jgi:hypothetical protein